MKRTIISLFYTTFLIFALFSSFNSFAGNDKVIRIMGDDNYPPFEYINDKGEPDGFNIDLIKTIMRDLGLNYTIELADWRIVLDSLKSNKVDLVLGMIYSANKADSLRFGVVHNFIKYCIVSTKPIKNASIELLKGKQIIVQNKKHSESILVENEYSNNLIKVNHFNDGLSLLKKGVGDFLMCSEDLARFYLIQRGEKNLEDLYINSINLSPREYRFTSSNRELLSTINKGFYNLKASGGYDVLYNNWFGIPHKSKWEKVFFYLLLFLLIVAVIGYSFIYILRKKVKNVTKKFQIEEAKYKTIFNSTSFGLEIYDKNGYLIEVNDACAKIFRVEDPKTIINDGNRYNLFKNPILKDRINKDKYSSFSDVFEYDFTNKDEKFAFTPRNDKFYLDIRYTPILDDKGDINSIILNTYEVTEIYEHQKILKNYKENLSIALEAGSLAAWIFDVKQQMFYKLEGNSFVNDGLSFTDYLDNLHPEDKYLNREIFNNLISGENDKASLIFRYKNQQGGYNQFESKMVVSKRSYTGVSYITGTQKDVTQELKKSLRLEELSKTLGIVMLAAEMSVWKYNVEEDSFKAFYGDLLINDGDSFDEASMHLTEESKSEFKKAFERLINSETITEHLIVTYINDNGSKLYLQKEIISHQDNSGNVVILYGTQKDITNDIIYKNELEYNIKMTNYAIKASDIAFMIYDCESGSIIGYNDPINNYNDDITYNLDYYRSKMHPDDVEEINHRDTILLNRLDKSYSVNIRIKFDENEDWRYCTISGAPFEYDSKGRVKKFVGFRKDNTKFHNMSKDIEEYANRLKYILSSSKIVYWYYDIKTSVISSYYGTDNVLHQTKDEYLNKIYDLDKEDTLDQFNRMDNKTQSEFTLNRSYIDTNGEVKNAIINGIPIKDEQGDIIGYSGLKRDITNMINIQRRLFLEKENAEKSFRSNCESIIEFENLIKSKIKDILNLIDKKSNIEDIKIRESISHLLDLISNNSIESRLISDCIDPNDSYGDLSTDERDDRNITLLIVEDNDSNFLLISAILKDYILYRAKNGVEAIEFVKNKVFNAIIMDIEMPIMDGLEATKIIRDMGVEIPIIALTANAYASDKKNAFKAGCNLFLSKPIRKRDLLNALNSNSIIWK